MLNYTTTTIVNSLNNILFANGTDIYEGSDLINPIGSTSDTFFSIKFGPKLAVDATHSAVLVGKKSYTAAKLATVEMKLPSTTANDIYRIALYIRLRNNNNPYFYNNWTFKGRPMYIEFNGSENAQNVADRAKKLMLAQYGYDLVKFTVSNANLVITAADQWEIFMDQDANKGVKLQELKRVNTIGQNPQTGDITHEEFQDMNVTYVTTTPTTAGQINVDNGNEAFGDFAHIVKDLRLPTDANLRWQGIAQGDVFGGEPNDDKPIPNGQYTQYTIQYAADRGVLQQTALGGVATSRTVHVFYVANAAVAAFDAALNSTGIAVYNADSDGDGTNDTISDTTPATNNGNII